MDNVGEPQRNNAKYKKSGEKKKSVCHVIAYTWNPRTGNLNHSGGRGMEGGGRKEQLFGLMDMSAPHVHLWMISQMYTNVKMHQTVHFNYVQFTGDQLNL